MKEATVMKVIRTCMKVRGDGTDKDPFRKVVQYWSLDGKLLAEKDAWTGSGWVGGSVCPIVRGAPGETPT